MRKEKPSTVLLQMILEMEAMHIREKEMLKDHFFLTYNSLKPINIIKDTLKEAIASPYAKTNIINTTIGLTTGFIAKKIFTGKSTNVVTRFAGIMLEMFITNNVIKNADKINDLADILMNKVLNHIPDVNQANK